MRIKHIHTGRSVNFFLNSVPWSLMRMAVYFTEPQITHSPEVFISSLMFLTWVESTFWLQGGSAQGCRPVKTLSWAGCELRAQMETVRNLHEPSRSAGQSLWWDMRIQAWPRWSDRPAGCTWERQNSKWDMLMECRQPEKRELQFFKNYGWERKKIQ